MRISEVSGATETRQQPEVFEEELVRLSDGVNWMRAAWNRAAMPLHSAVRLSLTEVLNKRISRLRRYLRRSLYEN